MMKDWISIPKMSHGDKKFKNQLRDNLGSSCLREYQDRHSSSFVAIFPLCRS